MLPAYERVILRKSPLSLVLGQVRFSIMPLFNDSAFTAKFHKAMRMPYPRIAREQQVAIQFTPKGMEPGPSEWLWRYSTRDDNWAVVLGESAITLESRGYSSGEEFITRFGTVLGLARNTLGITDRLRLGLRYINEIRHPEGGDFATWKRLLRPDLLGLPANDLLDGQVERALAETQFRMSDGILHVRHGFLTGTSVPPRPESPPPAGPFYLLDFDYYDPTDCELDVDATLASLRSYNDVLYRLFRWTLSEDLYNYLEPEHAKP